MEKSKAKEYSAIKVKLTILNCVFTVVVLSALIIFGWSQSFFDTAYSIFVNPFLNIAIYFIIFSLYLYVVAFPLSYYGSFFLEHKFELSNQTFGHWFLEGLKKEALTILFGIILIEVLYFFIRSAPTTWWFLAWGFFFLFSVVIGHIFPVLIIPLFYKYSDIEDKSLYDHIFSFVSEYGPKVKGVYSINLSKTTKKANAAFCGLGSTKRVILSDTLLNQFNADEIEMVLAHEIGHYKKKHILKKIVFETAISLIGFYVLYLVLGKLSTYCGFSGQADIAAFPVLYLVFFASGLLFLPIQNSFSRRMENEADDYAIQTATVKESFSSTMNKLADINLADRDPHPLVEFFLYSHPSVGKRLARQEQNGSHNGSSV
ncbi:M48 family metallopeptidase [Candidatus Omnitrophota bacterium]